LERELGGEVDVMIASNPCSGLDVATIAQIHMEIMVARNRGAAMLLISGDLDESLELADRARSRLGRYVSSPAGWGTAANRFARAKCGLAIGRNHRLWRRRDSRKYGGDKPD
jgi:ABC-type uncharacterized transport system ATPase subunit